MVNSNFGSTTVKNTPAGSGLLIVQSVIKPNLMKLLSEITPSGWGWELSWVIEGSF